MRLLASMLLHRSPIPCRPCCGEGVKHVAPVTTQLSISLRKLSRQLRSVQGSPWAPMTIPVVSKKTPKSLSLLTGKARLSFHSHLTGSRAGSRIMAWLNLVRAYKWCDISDVTTTQRRRPSRGTNPIKAGPSFFPSSLNTSRSLPSLSLSPPFPFHPLV